MVKYTREICLWACQSSYYRDWPLIDTLLPPRLVHSLHTRRTREGIGGLPGIKGYIMMTTTKGGQKDGGTHTKSTIFLRGLPLTTTNKVAPRCITRTNIVVRI